MSDYDLPDVWIIFYVGYKGEVSDDQGVEGVYLNEEEAIQRSRDLGGHYTLAGPYRVQDKIWYLQEEEKT